MRKTSLVAALLVTSACTDDHTHSSATDALQDRTIQFRATLGSNAVRCGEAIAALGTASTAAQLADARFFVHEVELRDHDGTWHTMELAENSFQHDGIALLDFEDGSAGCSDSGTSQMNFEIAGKLPEHHYHALRFKVGVPFEKNHLDNARAPVPLNTPGMFWSWQGGYKFLRVDFATVGGAVPRWNVHVGSTQCVSDSSATAPTMTCGRPNIATITVEDFDPSESGVLFDVGALVAGAAVHQNVAMTAPGCMSGPTEAMDCAPVFATLGVDFEQGRCAENCASQTAFRTASLASLPAIPSGTTDAGMLMTDAGMHVHDAGTVTDAGTDSDAAAHDHDASVDAGTPDAAAHNHNHNH